MEGEEVAEHGEAPRGQKRQSITYCYFSKSQRVNQCNAPRESGIPSWSTLDEGGGS